MRGPGPRVLVENLALALVETWHWVVVVAGQAPEGQHDA